MCSRGWVSRCPGAERVVAATERSLSLVLSFWQPSVWIELQVQRGRLSMAAVTRGFRSVCLDRASPWLPESSGEGGP